MDRFADEVSARIEDAVCTVIGNEVALYAVFSGSDGYSVTTAMIGTDGTVRDAEVLGGVSRDRDEALRIMKTLRRFSVTPCTAKDVLEGLVY